MIAAELLYEKHGYIAQITFNRPAVLNAFRVHMFHDLRQLLAQIADDEGVRVVVLTGAGRAFSAGIDLEEQSSMMLDPIPLKPAQDNLALMQDLTRRMVHLPKPIISAVNGIAVGVGAELAIASDVRLASTDAYFMFAEVKRALFETNGVMYYLPRLVGYGRAMQWMLTGERISAEQALEAGLITQMHAPDALLDAAMQMAERIANNAPLSVKLVKQAMQRAYDLDLEAMMQLEIAGMLACLTAEDYREGMQSFIEKRPPKYRGR